MALVTITHSDIYRTISQNTTISGLSTMFSESY